MDIGLQVFSSALGIGILGAWLPQRNESGGSWMRMPSRVFVRPPRYAGSLAIRRRALLIWSGGQKNSLRLLWSDLQWVVRSPHPARARSVLWRSPRLPGIRGSACAVQELRRGEARTARFSGRQPLLYPALRSLRRQTMSLGDDQRGLCRKL